MPRDPEFPRRCRDLAARRIADLGYRVERDDNRVSGLLRVAGAHGRFEIYVACVNGPTGYPMWLERRLALARDHLVMVLLYADSTTDPEFYVVPTEEWRSPQPPLVNPQYDGLASEPEYGIRISPSSHETLQRYRWRGGTDSFPSPPA